MWHCKAVDQPSLRLFLDFLLSRWYIFLIANLFPVGFPVAYSRKHSNWSKWFIRPFCTGRDLGENLAYWELYSNSCCLQTLTTHMRQTLWTLNLNLTITPRSDVYYLHFIDEDTEALRAHVNLSISPTYHTGQLKLKPSSGLTLVFLYIPPLISFPKTQCR